VVKNVTGAKDPLPGKRVRIQDFLRGVGIMGVRRLFLAMGMVSLACSSGSSTMQPGTTSGGGAGGTGGAAGAAGAGGMAGGGGTPGTGGAPTAPGAGNAGSAGNAGNAGSGGAAGSAGSGGGGGSAGSGGSAGDGACAGPSPSAVWSQVAPVPTQPPLDIGSVWADAPADAWLSGGATAQTGPSSFERRDQIQHWDGARWTTSLDGSPSHRLGPLFGFAGNDVWAGGDRVVHWDGTSWGDRSPPSAPGNGFTPIWGVTTSDVWVENQQHLIHWNGSGWADTTIAPAIVNGLVVEGFWGAASNDVWAVGQFMASNPFLGVLHWDGATWTQVTSPFVSNYNSEAGVVDGIWGSAANDIWAVGFSFSGSQIWHFDGSTWTHPPAGTVPAFVGQLYAVWGFCPNDIWAVGAEQPPGTQFVEQAVAIVLHFDGQSWSRVDLGGSFPGLLTVSGSSPDDLWAAGRGGTLLHRH
jgi:hypothetical protein